jgi:hypothetical protein
MACTGEETPNADWHTGESTPSERKSPRTSREGQDMLYSLPVGTHVLKNLPEDLSARLRACEGPLAGLPVATRVWLQRTRGELSLHLGDLEVKAPEN